MNLLEQEIMIHTIQKDHFEGWYARIQGSNQSIAVIFGISSVQEDPHGFIQTVDTMTHESQYIRFSLMDVKVQRIPFQISMKENVLSMYGLTLNLYEGDIKIKGTLTYSHLQPLKQTWYAPTIMGPFSYLPHMDCVHSILSMHHRVTGSIQIGDYVYRLDQGIGYMEKDRGFSFPKQYVWIQAMKEDDTSFVLAVADVPIGRGSFQGVLGCFLFDEQMVRFGSYYGAIAHVKIKKEHIYITLIQGTTRLYAHVLQQDGKSLKAPSQGSMSAIIKESLDSIIQVTLIHKGKRSQWRFTHCASEVCEALTEL